MKKVINESGVEIVVEAVANNDIYIRSIDDFDNDVQKQMSKVGSVLSPCWSSGVISFGNPELTLIVNPVLWKSLNKHSQYKMVQHVQRGLVAMDADPFTDINEGDLPTGITISFLQNVSLGIAVFVDAIKRSYKIGKDPYGNMFKRKAGSVCVQKQ